MHMLSVSTPSHLVFHCYRLQGIVSSMSRMPTFRRKFRNLVKILYIEALQASASAKEGNNIDEP